jgi:hypothetical protein
LALHSANLLASVEFEVTALRSVLIDMFRAFPGVHLDDLPFILPADECGKVMTHQINEFTIEPCTTNRHLLRRKRRPMHAYIFEITSRRIVLRATFPHETGLDREVAFDDAQRLEKDARKAAEELQRQLFG